MTENRSDIDEAAVRELFTSWSSPVGEYIRTLLDEAEAVALARVPKDTGRLAGSIRQAHVHSDTGVIKGCLGAGAKAGTPLSHPGWESGMPYALDLDNTQGFTWNRSPRGQKHTRGVRRLRPFLTAALRSLENRG